MSRLYLLVEGHTEEAFVKRLLSPHYARLGLYMTPIIAQTSPGHKGGLLRYAKLRPQLERLCKQDSGAWVSTLFDLYGLPADFPGKSEPAWPQQGSGHQKAAFLEWHMAQDIGRRNFLPHLMVYEYEALLFSKPECFAEWMEDTPHKAKALNALLGVRRHCSPEEINDSPETSPSKRIKAAMPGYQKAFHGPLIACEIGLEAIRRECPHFNAWLCKLETLKEGGGGEGCPLATTDSRNRQQK